MTAVPSYGGCCSCGSSVDRDKINLAQASDWPDAVFDTIKSLQKAVAAVYRRKHMLLAAVRRMYPAPPPTGSEQPQV
jgi:hypothetical protein